MSQDNKQVATIRVKVIPGGATPGGAIAAPFGQKGVSVKMFVDNFNELTKDRKGTITKPVAVKVKVFSDKSIEIIPSFALSVSDLVKEALNIKSIKSTTAGVRLTIKRQKVEEIAKLKQADLCVKTFEKAVKSIEGSIRSMAINIED
jgi:large subunit ribosomal protein L11